MWLLTTSPEAGGTWGVFRDNCKVSLSAVSPTHPPLSWWGQDCCPWQVFEWRESREVLPQASRNRGQAPHTSVIWAHFPATGPLLQTSRPRPQEVQRPGARRGHSTGHQPFRDAALEGIWTQELPERRREGRLGPPEHPSGGQSHLGLRAG